MPNASQRLFQNCVERPAVEVRVPSNVSLCGLLEASATIVAAAAVRLICSSNFGLYSEKTNNLSETTNCKGYVHWPWQVRPRATESPFRIAPEQAERRGVVVPPFHGLRWYRLLRQTPVPETVE